MFEDGVIDAPVLALFGHEFFEQQPEIHLAQDAAVAVEERQVAVLATLRAVGIEDRLES